jgi:predicted ATPase
LTDAAPTFFFSDIAGSSRLWEADPERMRVALKGHDDLTRRVIEAHGGHIVRTMGDGVYAVFDDPARALQTALALQLGLADPAVTHGLPLDVRCGLHRGVVERRDGDYYGPPVNRAARIMSVAHGGQTLVSAEVAERLQGRLPANASLRDLGRVRLRDLTGSQQLYQLMHPDLRAQFPPLRSLESTPNNLAQQLNSFVGREREVAEVRERLARSRLLTLQGMGGMGKSRLSVQLGAEVMDDYPDGVWLVELAPLTDPRGVPQAVASVLGVKEEAGQDLGDALLRHVRDRQMLLILDNCEHVLTACAALAKSLLQAGAGVRVLATSRDALQVAGERIYQVPALSVPDPQVRPGPDELMRHEAVRLFVDRATAAQPAFSLTPENAAAVADICRGLDGIPLALELAAARTRALSVQAIAQRLSDRFRLLVTSDQTVLPRQRTLRALIDWSWELLAEGEKVLFRRLAVFAGGWTLEAAEQVCAGQGLDGLEVLDRLSQLVEKSLVVMALSGERYRMLDTVQHYAQERLADSGDAPLVRSQHLAHYLALAEHARPAWTGPQQAAWLLRLDFERENFLSAHAWSENAAVEVAGGVRLLHALRPYWITRGSLTIGLRQADEVLARDGLRARDDWRCMALFAAGQFNHFLGRYIAARGHLSECLDIAREIGSTAIVARVLQPLGSTLVALGEYAPARACLEEALALARQQGDPREVALAVNAMTMLFRTERRPLDALQHARRSVELAREIGDPYVVGLGLLNWAMLCVEEGSLQDAIPMVCEVLELVTSTGSEPLAQSALEVCAGLAAAIQDWPEAAVFYGAAESRRERHLQRRAPADEAFLSPFMEAARNALGSAGFDEHALSGRSRPRESDLARALAWLRGLAL